jgi:heat-inducible transcriptional repressor
MSDLEEMGFLEQPHTSAGRIPSPRGYRLYVNELMESHKLTIEETRTINSALRLKMQELDRIISRAGQVISQLTGYPSFARSGGCCRATIRHYNLLVVDQSAYIIVVLTNQSVVKNKLLHFPAVIGDSQLQLINNILNNNFVGLSAEEITPELMQVAELSAGPAYGLLSLAISFALEVLEEQERQAVYMAGASHLLQQPEYQDVSKARQLMSYLSDDRQIARIPEPEADNAMKILIGPENIADELKDTSVVIASYDIGDNMRGLIGVVGPTRMDYSRVAARLSYFAEGMNRLFGGKLPPDNEEK